MEKLEPMVWNQEYSLEVPELDNQHKELMSFFNATVSKCSGDKADERTYIDSVKESFVGLLKKHFAAEEQFLSLNNDAGYNAHVLEHTKLLEKIQLIQSAIEANSWKMNLYILTTTLKDMFMYHFNTYDMNAKAYFGKGNKPQTDSLQKAG